MPKEKDELLWCAGFIDGEGHIGCYQARKSKYGNRVYKAVRIAVAQVTPKPLHRLRRTLGGKVYGPYQHKAPNRKPHWIWNTAGANAVAVLKRLEPHFSVKGSQAKHAIKVYRKGKEENKVPRRTGPKAKSVHV